MVTERNALIGLALAAMMVLSVAVGGVALGAQPDDGGAGNAPTEAPGGPPEDPGNETRGPPENGTGMPAGVENFTSTSPLSGDQTDPPSLAGKLRVESEYADNITVELVRNSSTNFSLEITGPENATNVTFYLQETAFAASQNLSNVSATLDGEPLALGREEANGSGWIGFEIDHFSTRTVTFRTENASGTDDTSDRADDAGPPALPGASKAPIDVDGDGRYEDLDGDGNFTVTDVQLLFAVYTSDDRSVLTDNAEQFDFNGDDGVGIGDIQALFDEYTSE